MDGRQLRALFKQFDDQYFEGKLSAYAIHSVTIRTRSCRDGCCFKKRRLIQIYRMLCDEEAIGNLIHEMAHAATNEHHGMPWKKEMIRLRETGAPLALADRNISLDDWDGIHLSKRDFLNDIQDYLIDAPLLSFRDAVRRFICSKGGAQSVAEFIRKYPWTRKAFKDAKREYAEDQRQQADLRAKFHQANLV